MREKNLQTSKHAYEMSSDDSEFLLYVRGLAIFFIVFGHVGGFWFFRPYSEFLHVVIPVFFFLAGAVSYYSYRKSDTTCRYYSKRILNLLVPYYMLCVLSLTVFVGINGIFPDFDLNKMLAWLQIRPDDADMPFPIGQIWFLHTLLIILLMSPLYIMFQKINEQLNFIIISFCLIISGVQLVADIDDLFYLFGNNLYKPIVHSIFFLLGMSFFSSDILRARANLLLLFSAGLAFSIFLVIGLDLNIDYGYHTFAPDLYYVAGSISAIALILLCQSIVIKSIRRSAILRIFLKFMHRHTLSIYLLHTFSIFVAETLLGFANPQNKTILYGITKLFVVMTITCALAVPFSYLASGIVRRMLFWDSVYRTAGRYI